MPEPIELPPRAGALGLAAVLLIDGLGLSHLPGRPLSGIVDEVAHLATGAVVLAAWPEPERKFAAGLAAGSVLIDVDHLPELWGRAWLRPRGVRPVPHSLLTPALAMWRARRTNSSLARGAAVGLTAHLVRDLATGTTGVALAWPLSRRSFSVRYRTYVTLLAALTAAALARAGSGSAPQHPESPRGSPPPPAPTPAPGPRQDSGGQ